MAQCDSALIVFARRTCDVGGGLASSAGVIFDADLQAMIEAGLTARIRVEPGKRSSTRMVERNGHSPGLLSTPAGNIRLGSRNCTRATTSVSCSRRATGLIRDSGAGT